MPFRPENWEATKDEVSFLMPLPVDFFDTFVPELIKRNVQSSCHGGYENVLPKYAKMLVRRAIEQTKNNTGMVLNFALSYGNRARDRDCCPEIAEKK